MSTSLMGDPVDGWSPPPPPGPEVMEGWHVRLERLDPAQHVADLFQANRADDAIWDYLPYGPFAEQVAYTAWAAAMAAEKDPWFYALRDRASGRAASCGTSLTRLASASVTVSLLASGATVST